jgi:LysR family transcriptional regulator, carnitine catabolism transcriptional activator
MSENTISIRHLRAFAGVSQFQSFSQAAKELRVSQPALTMAVRQLEDIVGTCLFERTTRKVMLTPEGANFLPTAERLLSDFNLAVQDIQAMATRRHERVWLTSVHSVATTILPHAIRDFSRVNPGIRIQIRDGNSSEVRLHVRRNEVDVGFASRWGDDDPELAFTPFFRDRMGLLAARNNPLFQLKDVKWSNLAGYDFIGLTNDTATGAILDRIPNLSAGIRGPRYEVSNNSTLWAMLKLGNGVTAAAALSALECAKDGLSFRPLSNPIVWRTVYVIARRGRTLTPATQELLAHTKAKLRTICKANKTIEMLDEISSPN